MKLKLFSTVALFAIGAFATAAWAGEDGSPCSHGDKGEVVKVTIDQAKKKKATFVDSNRQQTREKYGVIPGAILLTSSTEYDASKELPKDKQTSLVFYCANERCGASKKSAKRAAEAGYEDVAVLPVGIMGWKDAGHPVEKPKAKSREKQS